MLHPVESEEETHTDEVAEMLERESLLLRQRLLPQRHQRTLVAPHQLFQGSPLERLLFEQLQQGPEGLADQAGVVLDGGQPGLHEPD